MKLDQHQLAYIASFEADVVTHMNFEELMDSVVPGLCLNCGEVADSVEPDCHDGWCSCCEQNKVVSATELILSGHIEAPLVEGW